MKLLVIRPQPGADATAARVKVAGHDPVLMPLFKVEAVAWNVPSLHGYDALLLTSSNAARQLGNSSKQLRSLPVYAVGPATALAAEIAGLNVVAKGKGGIVDLLGMAQTVGHRNLLWLAGEDRIDAVVPNDMTLDVRIVYRSAALPPPSDFLEEVEGIDAVLLHSSRAARHFAELCKAKAIDRSTLTVAALSPAIAESVGSGWKSIVAAPEPNDSSLLSVLQSCFTK